MQRKFQIKHYAENFVGSEFFRSIFQTAFWFSYLGQSDSLLCLLENRFSQFIFNAVDVFCGSMFYERF